MILRSQVLIRLSNFQNVSLSLYFQTKQLLWKFSDYQYYFLDAYHSSNKFKNKDGQNRQIPVSSAFKDLFESRHRVQGGGTYNYFIPFPSIVYSNILAPSLHNLFIQKHKRFEHDPVLLDCAHCSKKFNKAKMKAHILANHRNPGICGICGKKVGVII